MAAKVRDNGACQAPAAGQLSSIPLGSTGRLPGAVSRYFRWAQKEHPLRTRIAATLPAGPVFLILLPLVVVAGGRSLDRLFALEGFHLGAPNYVFSGLLVIVGFFFGFWSILVQFTRGRGTPLPMMPTQQLLTNGPFRYCRNPMTFGTILAYAGIGVLAGTIAGIGLALCFAALLVLYLKRNEERELAERFGEPYLEYKRQVPFIIPRPPKRQ